MLTKTEDNQVRYLMGFYPYRIIYVARKPGEVSTVSAVETMRIPNKLARDGYEVLIVASGSLKKRRM